MRDVITAIIILVLIISISVTFYCLSMNFCNDMSENLLLAKEAVEAGDYTLAAKYSQNCIDILEKSNLWLSAMANHEELNSIKTGLLRAQQFIAFGDDEETMAELGEVSGLINHFAASEQINIENIF